MLFSKLAFITLSSDFILIFAQMSTACQFVQINENSIDTIVNQLYSLRFV